MRDSTTYLSSEINPKGKDYLGLLGILAGHETEGGWNGKEDSGQWVNNDTEQHSEDEALDRGTAEEEDDQKNQEG